MGPWLLGLARKHVAMDCRPLVGLTRVSRLGLDRRPMGLGRNRVGVARRLLGTYQLNSPSDGVLPTMLLILCQRLPNHRPIFGRFTAA